MHTGDLATMDDDGYVNIVGRIKDMVIRGGENIYPREVEEFLYGHPAVADVQVIGVPDERYGEELMAWVSSRPGRRAVDEEAARASATARIAHYKVPRYVKFVDEFPMTVTGKVQKFKLRERAIARARPRGRDGQDRLASRAAAEPPDAVSRAQPSGIVEAIRQTAPARGGASRRSG